MDDESKKHGRMQMVPAPGVRVNPGLARKQGIEPMVVEATTAEAMERIVQFIAEDD